MIISTRMSSPIQRRFSYEDWTSYDAPDSDLVAKRRFQNFSKYLDENYNYIRDYSRNRDKQTLDEFNWILNNYWQVPTTASVYRDPYITYTPITRRYRPVSYVEASPYIDVDNLPTRNLRAHPKLKIEVISNGKAKGTPESDIDFRKRIIDERLDRILGYRSPRYKLSKETQEKISNSYTNQIRKLFPKIVFDENVDTQSKKIFINSMKH